jgi:hypothetical protein
MQLTLTWPNDSEPAERFAWAAVNLGHKAEPGFFPGLFYS